MDGQDFTHREVCDRNFGIIEEVFQRYEIDGMDLNFMRHPVLFSRTMRGQPGSIKELQIMTNQIRRMRRFVDEWKLERERTILVAAVKPDTLQLCRNVGLDIAGWTKEDLIDIVVPSLAHTPFSLAVDQFMDRAHVHGVKVYLCIDRQTPQQAPNELEWFYFL